MPDWTKTMKQTFEYYVVDPRTWKDIRPIHDVISSSIKRDAEAETLSSLTIDISEPIGECYIRVYLVTNQNGIKERFPLGTFIIQTPVWGFDGKAKKTRIDAYSPLLELKEKKPPFGYSILEQTNIMESAYKILRENMRAPIIKIEKDQTLHYDFVSNTEDTWITFIRDLLYNAKYRLGLDELGRVVFEPIIDQASQQPVWYFNDDNSSILQATVDVTQDLYGIPNVVEVIYSTDKKNYYSRAVNDDSDSIVSTVNRGREILYREVNPNTIGNPTQEQLDDYAKRLLKQLSSLEYSITYTHGYCPVRIGDCVMINYERAGLRNIKAKVITQQIDCVAGCMVTETATFTNRLWGD